MGVNAGTASAMPARRFRVTPMQLVWGAIILFELGFMPFVFVASIPGPNFGLDYRWHMDAARRLLDTGTPYYPYQLRYCGSHLRSLKLLEPSVRSRQVVGTSATRRPPRVALTVSSRASSNPARLSIVVARRRRRE